MLRGSLKRKVLTIIIPCILMILIMSVSLWAETHLGTIVGKISSPRNVWINGSSVPSERVILSGELISAQDSPALITLRNGGSLVLTQGSVAMLSQLQNALSVRAERGTIGFQFQPGEKVQIETASHRFIASNPGLINIGELSIGGSGERISVKSGGFYAVEKSDGRMYEVNSSSPLLQETGKGILTRGRNTLTDETQNWILQELMGKCIAIGGEIHKIIGVAQTRLTVDGEWSLANGIYEYRIDDCVGAVAAKQPGKTSPPVAKKGMSKGTKTTIGVLVAGGAAGGVLGVMKGLGGNESKSPY